MEEYVLLYLQHTALRKDDYVHQRMRRFFVWLRGRGVQELAAVTPQHIEQWLCDMRSRGLAEGTRYAYLATVRSFFTVLYREKYIESNPWPDYIRTTKPKTRPRKTPTPQQVLEVLAAAGNTTTPQRTRAMLEVAYGCGLRRMELRNLNVSDIIGDTLRIRGKGGKERIVPLGRRARESIETYLYGERIQIVKKHNPHEEALFVTVQGRRPCIENYAALMQRLQLKNHFGLHSLRHACATHMLRNGANIRVLQKLLGHDHLQTTQVYTRVDTDDLKRTLKNHHPRQ